jgi:hypothetical protein
MISLVSLFPSLVSMSFLSSATTWAFGQGLLFFQGRGREKKEKGGGMSERKERRGVRERKEQGGGKKTLKVKRKTRDQKPNNRLTGSRFSISSAASPRMSSGERARAGRAAGPEREGRGRKRAERWKRG